MKQETNKLDINRHSCSHVMAAAILKLYPKVKLGIGPSIENGFYYDFDFPEPIEEKDLEKISILMEKIIKEDLSFIKNEVGIDEAKKIFKDQPYKLDLIEDLAKEGNKKVSLYKTGDFIDLCAGPHVEKTSDIGAFKLLSLAGAYWRGSEKNKMLTRIYATCFSNQKELETHLNLIEEIKKRDHRKIGPQLELFLFHETAPGMPYWLPKGLIILNELINFWRVEHSKRGYQEIKTPLINKKELYITSGHWEHYQNHMFISQTKEGEIYGLKPMNCPNAMVVFGFKTRSYRDLPMRLSDTDTLHRHELSGTLNGLLRVREFSQDDAHIFITEDQIKSEYQEIFKITELFYSIFNLDYSFRLGTRPENFMGDRQSWDKAEKELKEILKTSGKPFSILEGDGAFYGPKIDILMKDSLGREWQMGTIQLDFQIPKRFKLVYVDKDGQEKTPVVVHRVIYGSLERFMGILIEHCAGSFPVWLAPIQTKIITINDQQTKNGEKIAKELNEKGIRAEYDSKTATVSAKIREAELQKIPYILVVGDKEIKEKTVNVRARGEKVLGQMKIEKFIELIKTDIAKKR
ncbi:MAG: threonine--tRNA ligase [Candidatus Shapirobacteria bacterium]|nr:threonine--tRNA ligase [Candidatus Shapirobacteria bacterium]